MSFFKHVVWAYVVIGLLITPSLYWIVEDCSVWPWDQAWYGEVSVDLWFTLVNHPANWGNAMVHAFGSKAPGVAWLGQFFVPSGRWMHSTEDGLLLSIVVVQVATLVLMYRIGKVFVRNQELLPVLMCVFVGAAPLFVAMTHQYLAEPLQLFAVTYFYWIAAVAFSFERKRVLAHLLVASSLAFLAKVTSPLYCFAPAGIALWEVARARTGSHLRPATPSRPHWPIFVGGAVLSVGAALWYGSNFGPMRQFVIVASSSDVALDYGKKDIFLHKLHYWLVAMQKSIIVPEALALVMVVVIGGVGLSRGRGLVKAIQEMSGRLSLLAAGAVIEVLAVLTVFSININEENRFLLPLLPSLAIIFLWAMSLVRIRLAAVVALVALLSQWALIESQAFGIIPPNPRVSYWVLPVHTDGQAMRELRHTVDLTCSPHTANRYNIAGVEFPWLNANSLSFYSAVARLENGLRCYYTSLGYAEKDPYRAYDRLESLRIAHFISIEESAQPNPPNFVNEVSRPILARIKNDVRFIRQPFDSRLQIVVFKNRDKTT